MSCVFLDGFDKYGQPGETNPVFSTLLLQEWTSLTYNAALTTPLSVSGYALTINTAGNGNKGGLSKTFAASVARAIGGFRFNAVLNQALVEFQDAGTGQCSIVVLSTGNISFRVGGTGNGNAYGTLIASSAGTITAGSTHYLEWDITIGPAGSAYNIYLDGVSIISGTATTRTTGNSTYNGLFFMGQLNSSSPYVIDDLYVFNSSGSFNNAVLLTDPRVETQYPSSDSQTQFTNAGNVVMPAGLVQTGVSQLTGTVNAPGANQIALLKITPQVGCNLQSVSLSMGTTSATAKHKAVLYADSAGAPGSLLATGTEVVGTTSGSPLVLPFASGQALTGGTSYWIGYIGDTSVNLGQYDATTNLGWRKANTYTSGPPSPAGTGFTTGQATWLIWGNCTGATTNWRSVANNPAPGAGQAADTSSIISSTVSQEDLYGFPNLATSPANVYVVAVKANAKKSDTGARTADVRLKSNTTDSAGSVSGFAPAVGYAWLSSYFDTNPDTSGAWSASTVNAATSGVKVAS
jgi:hypothetical protein